MQVGIPLHPPDSRPKPKNWYEKPLGIVALGVIITIIGGLILAWCLKYLSRVGRVELFL